MFVINSEILPEDKIYRCNQYMADWLVYEMNIPLLSKAETEYIFAKTDLLKEILMDVPFWLKFSNKFL